MKWQLTAALVALAIAGGCSDSSTVSSTPTSEGSRVPPPASVSVDRVLEVIDGDTFSVTIDGAAERVRLIGVDAPESGECMSAEATAALGALIRGGVQLVRDVNDRDQYGRLLRYVEAGEVFVNEELVRRGLALAREYPPDTARQTRLADAQAAAKDAERGIWNPTACGPATAAEVEISNINANPSGDDTENLNEEWIELTNRGAVNLDLTGWVIRDESASHRFTFASGFILGTGAKVRLHTGCGEASDTDLFWCMSGSTVWNNDGDTVFLLDVNGNIVVLRHYSS